MKTMVRELDFTRADMPHPEAKAFIERGTVDCMTCLPTMHPILAHSSEVVEGEPWTILSFKCRGRTQAMIFEDPAESDDPSGDGVMGL